MPPETIQKCTLPVEKIKPIPYSNMLPAGHSILLTPLPELYSIKNIFNFSNKTFGFIKIKN